MVHNIRRAAPQDASFIAWTVLTAARSHCPRAIWDVILGDDENFEMEYLTALASTSAIHNVRTDCFCIAEIDGFCAAALGGYDPREFGSQSLIKGVEEIKVRLGLQRPSDDHRKAVSDEIRSCVPEDYKQAWRIEYAATRPEYRGRGLMTDLVQRQMDEGRLKKLPYAQINIFIGNEPAQRIYEKLGFRIIDQKLNETFQKEIGSPGIARMLCTL
jgi:ribosomal protein S18 acetylase RimI-like enzyme